MLSLADLVPNPLATFTMFVGGLADLDIEGVTRKFGWGQPESIDVPALPAMWVTLPESDAQLMTFEGGAGTHVMKLNMWIAVAQVAQSGQETRFRAAVLLMDYLFHALSHEDLDADDISISKLTWTMKLTEVEVGQVVYTAVHALITGRG